MKRGIRLGCAASIGAGIAGGLLGWFVGGPLTNDPYIWAILGSVGAALLAFAIAGPPGRFVIATGAAIGAVVGFTLAGWLTQDQELGAVMWAWSGGGLGLLVGAAIGAVLVKAMAEDA